jgi:hypothetical protein
MAGVSDPQHGTRGLALVRALPGPRRKEDEQHAWTVALLHHSLKPGGFQSLGCCIVGLGAPPPHSSCPPPPTSHQPSV